MKNTATEAQPAPPQPKYRKDYQPPTFLIDTVDLSFELGDGSTVVEATLAVRRTGAADAPLELHGEELELLNVSVDGVERGADSYQQGDESLVLPNVPDSFELKTRVRIKPELNTSLMGLYRSNGTFCTQCEAEGFRRITFFLDRPDVMSRFRVRIEGDKEATPVMLSNGNRVDAGELDNGRHWVQWEDPFPKPAYLFALVAGQLACHEGTFKTSSGRDVRLEIWVEPQNIDRCEHALVSLQKSMKWDEEVFGLEYDLDIYMIVAVNDFNMGAMENKGLNVFNAKYVLARPDTATDGEYEGIEAVIAHEYFHNWTGNRVTCRDWFQLTLKEGLTVYRDARFTSDMTSEPVKRIGDVRMLRATQFAEAAGPMAHPIRPESYIEMNNFYTVTVYEKGAEVIRMYETLLGRDGFRKGMDLYFERHDGQAVTCDDFRAAMADANGVDLAQFERWYSQAGTPKVTVTDRWDESAGEYSLTLRQDVPRMGEEAVPEPAHVPLLTALFARDGSPLPLRLTVDSVDGGVERVLELKQAEETFTFTGLSERPVPSVNRGFSAPIVMEFGRSRADLAFLMGHDTDPFNRWDAGQVYAEGLLLEQIQRAQRGDTLEVEGDFVAAWGRILDDESLDGSIRSLALSLPAERQLGLAMQVVDPDAIHKARRYFITTLSKAFEDRLIQLYDRLSDDGDYRYATEDVARRSLRNSCLGLLCSLRTAEGDMRAYRQFQSANNMTDTEAALTCLAQSESPLREQALEEFYKRWKDDPLVLDKWFRIQATSSLESTIDVVRGLLKHEDFTITNPNRVRSLVGAFAVGNQVRFHRADGAGYETLAEFLLEFDSVNPQVASRLVSAFNPWKRFDEDRQAKMKTQLERIAAKEGLSKDVFEIVSRNLS